MTLLDKLNHVNERVRAFSDGAVPFDTVIGEAHGPCEVVVDGRRTLMCGSNNYFGLSFHPDVIEAARDAVARHGSGPTGSRAANGTLAIHPGLESEVAGVYGQRPALVFPPRSQAEFG